MFIENLRNVKKKWKIPALVLIVLLVMGLLSSFAYLGATYGNVGSGNNAQGLEYYATAAENAEKSAKDSDDAETVLAAAAAFDDYATYQVLYLDKGSVESYGKMKEYAEKLLSIYGSQETEDADWAAAYMYVIRASLAVDDVDGAREAFNESLTAMTLTSDYLNDYTSAMMAKEFYSELAEDMEAAEAVLEPLAAAEEEAGDEEAEAEEEAAEDTQDATEDAAETPADVLATAQSNAQYAQMMASMNTTTDTADDSQEETSEEDTEAE
ncbi:MAG: hypothetical protein Q4C00_04400 [Bacillota bacterium]|nr:hypothetical protein [Bacillota bacterium]